MRQISNEILVNRFGLKIVGCIKLANKTLGPILFTELGLAMFNFIINAYFICTIYALFYNPFPWVTLYFIVVNLLSFIMALYRIFNPTRACEKLNRVLELSKDCLQNYQVRGLILFFLSLILILFLFCDCHIFITDVQLWGAERKC